MREHTSLFISVLGFCLSLAILPDRAECFSTPPRFAVRSAEGATLTASYAKRSSSSVPEYSLDQDTPGTVDESLASESPHPAPRTAMDIVRREAHTSGTSKSKIQYSALEPGTVVQIKVGDVGLARKAWKKRRRSGSPLLVPCSVLNVDRRSTIRWNLIYLLEKFGTSSTGGSVRVSLAELTRRYGTHLQSSLAQHAIELRYETTQELVEALFSKQFQESCGVQIVHRDEENSDDDASTSNLWLHAPISRQRAQKRASRAVMLQFSHSPEDDVFQHTGIVRMRRKDSNGYSSNSSDGGDHLYELGPLSAALRVSQNDVDLGTVQNGTCHAAVVFDFDSAGDAGNPLLTLSLNPARNQVRDRLRIEPDRKYQAIQNPKYCLGNLKIGDGPIPGKVTKLVKGGALVDCRVGRETDSPGLPKYIKVYGTLRFQDTVANSRETGANTRIEDKIDGILDDDEAVDEVWDSILSLDELDSLDREENDELVEDITHMFEIAGDGSLTYRDPVTGETTVVSDDDDEDNSDNEEEDEDEKDKAEHAKPSIARGSTEKRGYWGSLSTKAMKSQWLTVGDMDVYYVKSVSENSGQLVLTMDSSIQGRRAKELKKEAGFNKKLTRLAKQLGGLHRIDQLRGQRCDGVVKATSNAGGNWVYVQPTTRTGDAAKGPPLPVGVASVPEDIRPHLKKGDAVRIQIEGFDEDRGQLAMRVLGMV